MSLSLVLPCYNVMKYLPKCLDSIFKNDCSDIEIVLVNDGSSDDIGGGKHKTGEEIVDADIAQQMETK